VTDFERAAMARVGRVDLAITPLVPSYNFAQAIALPTDYLRTYRPDVIMPAHHDGGRARAYLHPRRDFEGQVANGDDVLAQSPGRGSETGAKPMRW
jgi:hypothetical protein